MTHTTGKPQVQLSRHAELRMAQRAISKDLLMLLFEYGDQAACGGRSAAVTVNPLDLSYLRQIGLPISSLERLSRLRAVVANDGTLVTVMHCHKRASRH